MLRTTLFHRMREFLEVYDALILPVAPLPAFAADLQYPPVVAGRDAARLSGLDALGLPRDGHRASR